jgi:hypothetical protein
LAIFLKGIPAEVNCNILVKMDTFKTHSPSLFINRPKFNLVSKCPCRPKIVHLPQKVVGLLLLMLITSAKSHSIIWPPPTSYPIIPPIPFFKFSGGCLLAFFLFTKV